MGEGEYKKAQECFERLNRTKFSKEKIAQCQFLYAQDLFNKGEYSAAEEEFNRLDLSEYAARAKTKAMECEYALGQELYDKGEYVSAAEKFGSLGRFQDSIRRREECLEAQYEKLNNIMYSGEWSEAASGFNEIKEYKDSADLSSLCTQRLREKEAYGENVYITQGNLNKTYSGGKAYRAGIGNLYVPDEINADTATLLYFAGGRGEFKLYVGGMDYYLENYRPNALMLFCYESGIGHQDGMCQTAGEILTGAAIECNILIHNFAIAGSSSGAYTAMTAVSWFYDNLGISAYSLNTLDTAEGWGLPFMSDERFESFQKAAPRLYLFEQYGMGLNVRQIRRIVGAGLPVTMIYCREGSHNAISANAYTYGAFSFMTGETDELDEVEYKLRSIGVKEYKEWEELYNKNK